MQAHAICVPHYSAYILLLISLEFFCARATFTEEKYAVWTERKRIYCSSLQGGSHLFRGLCSERRSVSSGHGGSSNGDHAVHGPGDLPGPSYL